MRSATLLLLFLASSMTIAAPDMTTYTNRQHGFSIKFPADWVVEEGSMGTLVIVGSVSIIGFNGRRSGKLPTHQ